MEERRAKPPLGLMPRFISLTERQNDIIDAINRYNQAEIGIPKGWLDELHENNFKIAELKKVNRFK